MLIRLTKRSATTRSPISATASSRFCLCLSMSSGVMHSSSLFDFVPTTRQSTVISFATNIYLFVGLTGVQLVWVAEQQMTPGTTRMYLTASCGQLRSLLDVSSRFSLSRVVSARYLRRWITSVSRVISPSALASKGRTGLPVGVMVVVAVMSGAVTRLAWRSVRRQGRRSTHRRWGTGHQSTGAWAQTGRYSLLSRQTNQLTGDSSRTTGTTVISGYERNGHRFTRRRLVGGPVT